MYGQCLQPVSNSLMNLHNKLLLRKRALVETVNGELKNVCNIEHTRHSSIGNFASNLIAGLIAYNLLPKKPSMNIDFIDKSGSLHKILIPNSRYFNIGFLRKSMTHNKKHNENICIFVLFKYICRKMCVKQKPT